MPRLTSTANRAPQLRLRASSMLGGLDLDGLGGSTPPRTGTTVVDKSCKNAAANRSCEW